MAYQSIFREGLFAGQVVIVTGGGSGIGRCTAHELAALGATVALVGRKPEKLATVAAEIAEDGGKASTHACDIREEEKVAATIAAILKTHGRIDGLVNNAGGQFQAPLEAISQKGWETVVQDQPHRRLPDGARVLHAMDARARRRHRQHRRRHVERHARHGPQRRRAGGHGQLHRHGGRRMGRRGRARQRRGAGLDRLLGLRRLSRQRQAHAALAAPPHAAAALRHRGRGLRRHRLPAVARRRLHLRRDPARRRRRPQRQAPRRARARTTAPSPGTASTAPCCPRRCRRSDALSSRNFAQRNIRDPGAANVALGPGSRAHALGRDDSDGRSFNPVSIPTPEAFRANRRDMLALVEGFRALEARVRDTSNQKLPMFQKRGQLTPRQRLAHLIDRGSPFLELSTLAGLEHARRRRRREHPGRRRHRRHRLRLRRALDDHGQRLRHQGRHHRADGLAQVAARAGHRHALQAALHLAGGVGRRQPQLPGRDLRRRRPHLRQHGAHVGHGHPAHRRRARLLHRRRRLSSGPLATMSWW